VSGLYFNMPDLATRLGCSQLEIRGLLLAHRLMVKEVISWRVPSGKLKHAFIPTLLAEQQGYARKLKFGQGRQAVWGWHVDKVRTLKEKQL